MTSADALYSPRVMTDTIKETMTTHLFDFHLAKMLSNGVDEAFLNSCAAGTCSSVGIRLTTSSISCVLLHGSVDDSFEDGYHSLRV